MHPLARTIRRTVLEQSKRAHVGHIGSALSIADILAALYDGWLRMPDSDATEGDRFILSKGHAALALYAALAARGIIPESQLDTFCGDESLLGVHPEWTLDGVDFSTGSLGHGLPVAVGMALSARLSGSSRRVVALLSDAECNAGAVWEAAMFAAHHKLANLTVLIDANGQQALGFTRDVLDLSPMEERWAAFGWDAQRIDGHDVSGIQRALHALDHTDGPPHVLVAETTFGKGVSYMEGRIKWHYMPMSDEEFAQAMQEVGEA